MVAWPRSSLPATAAPEGQLEVGERCFFMACPAGSLRRGQSLLSVSPSPCHHLWELVGVSCSFITSESHSLSCCCYILGLMQQQCNLVCTQGILSAREGTRWNFFRRQLSDTMAAPRNVGTLGEILALFCAFCLISGQLVLPNNKLASLPEAQAGMIGQVKTPCSLLP